MNLARELEREIRRDRIDQNKIAPRERGRGHAIENHHVEGALLLRQLGFPMRRASHLHVRKQPQQAAQIRIAGTDIEQPERRLIGQS